MIEISGPSLVRPLFVVLERSERKFGENVMCCIGKKRGEREPSQLLRWWLPGLNSATIRMPRSGCTSHARAVIPMTSRQYFDERDGMCRDH